MLTRLKASFRPVTRSVCSFFALSLSFSMLVGCGGGGYNGNTPAAPGTSSPLPADNWNFTGTPATREIGAALHLSASAISGTAHVFDNGNAPCYDLHQSIPLSGTIDSQGNVSVTSPSVVGQVLSFTGVLSADRSSISSGNHAFTGGCAGGDSGSWTGVKFKPVTGAYGGTLASGSPVSASAKLTQSPTLGSDGFLHVNGTVTYTNPDCNEEFTITDSQLAGRFIQLTLTARDGSTTVVYGNVDSEASQIQLADYDGGCHGVGGVGFLTQE